jgi:hypothetical protein
MRALSSTILSTAIAAGALAYSVTGASAAIVCNDDVCWHVKETYRYPPGARVMVHPDHWRWGPRDRYRWREHAGRGYWRGDNWVEFGD